VAHRMDKNRKHHRDKTIPRSDLDEVAPPGASFDTEQGRASQGMRQDIGKGQDGREKDALEDDEVKNSKREQADES